jgi:hypothetical protein
MWYFKLSQSIRRNFAVKTTTILAILCSILMNFCTLSCGTAKTELVPQFSLKQIQFKVLSGEMLKQTKPAVWTIPADQKSEDAFLTELKGIIHNGIDRYSSLKEINTFKNTYGYDISAGVLLRDGERYLHDYDSGKIIVMAYPKQPEKKALFRPLSFIGQG